MSLSAVIGPALRKQRLSAGLLQEDVADKVGVSVFTISRFETGKRKPSEKTLRKLCALYGLDYAAFMVSVYSQMASMMAAYSEGDTSEKT